MNVEDAGFWEDVQILFADAIALDPRLRASLLNARCGGRPALRAEVESLISANGRSDGFLQVAAVARETQPEPEGARDESGRTIGPFRLCEKIGEGGMGSVYRGERIDGGFTQRVAVKLIDARLRNPDTLRRFRSERQILATLNHPNIVTLLDGGVTDDGQAYLVMECVDGVPITAYCAGRRLPLEDRLRLFRQVCSAVDHAHRHAIVHRDLKPANILATSEGTPKVLDFGVAKLLAPPEGLEGHTATSALPGPLTANYASPEQLRGLPVTSASDVYALGVLLYELLSGSRPYETTGRPLDELLQVVLVAEPIRPSASPASAEAVPPYDHARLRGDLDSIVLKAIAKLPADRYVSVEALSDDIARFLEHRPVHARRGVLAHRARTLAGTHGRGIAAALILSMAVVAGSLVAGVPDGKRGEDSRSPRAPRGGTTNVTALEAYKEGRKLWDVRDDFARAAAAFRRAIAADPQFALGHVGLADSLAMWQVPSPESERALAEALRLAPLLGEAHATQGFIRMFHYWDWVGAEESLRRAIELAPEYATAHQWQGILFAITRRFDAAEASLRRATELAPQSAVILGDLGLTSHWRGNHTGAAEICERARRLGASSFVLACLSSVYSHQGRHRDAVRVRGDNKLMSVFEARGYDAVLRELLRLAESEGYGGMYDATVLHAELGQNAAALESLRRMVVTHHFMTPFVNVAPAFQELRGDPQFQQALRAMGLAESGRR